MDGDAHSPYYELSAGVQPLSWLSASVIIVDSRNHGLRPELAVGTVRIGTRAVALDVGKTGISLGLTPPVYAGRRTVASRPNISSAVTQLALSAYGVPEYAVGVVGTLGAWSYSAHYYSLQQQSLIDALVLGVQSGALETPGEVVVTSLPNGEATEGCTLCGVFTSATGYSGGRDDRFDRFFLDFMAQALGSPAVAAADPQARVDLGRGGYHAGLYWDGYTSRAAVDLTILETPDITYLLVPAVEYTYGPAAIGVQLFSIMTGNRGTYGGHLWATCEVSPQFLAYLRYGEFSGRLRASEAGAGLIANVGPVYTELGLEFLDVDLIGLADSEISPTLAMGVLF